VGKKLFAFRLNAPAKDVPSAAVVAKNGIWPPGTLQLGTARFVSLCPEGTCPANPPSGPNVPSRP
jgi:hypothetical protein